MIEEQVKADKLLEKSDNAPEDQAFTVWLNFMRPQEKKKDIHGWIVPNKFDLQNRLMFGPCWL